MADLAPCGHSIGYMYRIRDLDGIPRKFCFACIIEHIGIKDFNGLVPVKAEKVKKEKKEIILKTIPNIRGEGNEPSIKDIENLER